MATIVDNAVDNEIERTAQTDEFWEAVRIQPVRIALPAGVGYTLRAYRMSDTLPQDVDEPDDTDTDSADTADTGLVTKIADDEAPLRRVVHRDDRAEVGNDADDADADEFDDEPALEDFEDEPDKAAERPVEEVPVFLARRGKLLLFRSEEGLAEFVRSDARHDLLDLAEWNKVADKLDVSRIVPTEDDSYELDLIVENLRGGHDVWDAELIISAGEITRDLGYALRIEPVQISLSAGSPLDDLDEALRASTEGGLGALFARRKIKKIGAEQAALAWRTIVGKISAAVDWRD